VCAGRIEEVLRTSTSVVAPVDGITELPGGVARARHAESRSRAPSSPCCAINFRVDAARRLAVIGSTGSGKTALLNVVARCSTSPPVRC
jgi:ATP-binding cassette subfamily B protein